MVSPNSLINRGALIVLEGCDCSGKSTHSKLLVSFLQSKNVNVKHMVFPARDSPSGQIINSYLRNNQELPDECIHLLFSVNRWEFKTEMMKLLEAGTTLVVDRYSYSGVAYSVAKGLNYDWCKAPDIGLIKPDLVFYLKASIDTLSERRNFGEERYEKKEFQLKVSDVFDRICNEEKNYWHKVDVSESVEIVQERISEKALQTIRNVENEPLKVLQKVDC